MRGFQILYFIIVINLFHSCNKLDFDSLQIVGEIKGAMDISAISCIHEKKCLIASDELTYLQFVSLESKKLIAHEVFIKLSESKHENDIEGLTNDGKYFYAVSSHSLGRKNNKYRSQRFKIFKILIDDSGRVEELYSSSLEPILEKNERLKSFLRLPTKENGIDIEGLAFKNNKLYIGFRGPVINEHAQILEIDSNLFTADAQGVKTKNYSLKTSQEQGIRSMEFLGSELGIIIGKSNHSKSSKKSKLIIFNLEKNSIIKSEDVPLPYQKLEAFEVLTNKRLFLYDSQPSGMPVQTKKY